MAIASIIIFTLLYTVLVWMAWILRKQNDDLTRRLTHIERMRDLEETHVGLIHLTMDVEEIKYRLEDTRNLAVNNDKEISSIMVKIGEEEND